MCLDLVNHAQHPPALNPHLTKSRLNDAPSLCEMAYGDFQTPRLISRRFAFECSNARLEGEQDGTVLDARRMSTSTVAYYDLGANNHKRSARKTSSRHFFGSAAVASLVLGCAWTVYSNIFAAGVYPSLSSTSFDTPVIKRPPSVAAVRGVPMANAKVADAFAD